MASANTVLKWNSTSANATILASAARVETAVTGAVPIDFFTELMTEVDVTAASGTSPTLDVRLQTLLPDTDHPADAGAGWCDIAAFAQIITTGKYILHFASGGSSTYTVTDGTLAAGTIKAASLGSWVRCKCTIGGTNPSFTFSVSMRART